MRHIDIYLFVTYFKQKLNLSDATICHHLSEKTGKNITPKDLQGFMMSKQPGTKQIIHALLDYGVPQKEICEFLGLSQATVSYHANTAPKTEYVNTYWRTMIEEEWQPRPGVYIRPS